MAVGVAVGLGVADGVLVGLRCFSPPPPLGAGAQGTMPGVHCACTLLTITIEAKAVSTNVSANPAMNFASFTFLRFLGR